MKSQVLRVLAVVLFGACAAQSVSAQDAVPPAPQQGGVQQLPDAVQPPLKLDVVPQEGFQQPVLGADPARDLAAWPWFADYGGTEARPYGSAETMYYPWPGIPYYGPRYYGFRPSWFGSGYPTSDFAGFWW